MILFWRLSICLHSVFFSPAARGEPVCRRLSSDACGDLVCLQVEWEGGGFVLAFFQQFYTRYIYSRLRGGNRFASVSLETFAAFLVRLQAEWEGGFFIWACFQQCYTLYIYPRPRRVNRFGGESLETFAAIPVRLQAEREGGDFVLASFNKFTPRIFLPGCAGGTGLPAGR